MKLSVTTAVATALMSLAASALATVSSADRKVLSEGCSSIKAAERRAKCFEVLSNLNDAAPSPAPPVVITPPAPVKSAEEVAAEKRTAMKAKYAKVLEAFTSIKAATNTGLSYNDYNPLILSAATQIELMRSEATTERETAALELFSRAINAHKDAATFWSKDIEFFARRRNKESYFSLPIDQVGVTDIVLRWRIPIGNADLLGFNRGVARSQALSVIWAAAQQYVDEGTGTLLGEAAPVNI